VNVTIRPAFRNIILVAVWRKLRLSQTTKEDFVAVTYVKNGGS
jgi:hypothetical protein